MNRLRDWLAGLTRRERILLASGTGVLALLFLYGVVQGVRGRMARQKAAIVEMTKSMQELRELAKEYRNLDATLKQVESQISESSPEKVMDTLSKIAEEEGLEDRMEGMKQAGVAGTDPEYEEIAVEFRLLKVTTDSLVRFLFKVESAPGYIKVKRLVLTGKGEPGSRSLDADVQVSMFKKRT